MLTTNTLNKMKRKSTELKDKLKSHFLQRGQTNFELKCNKLRANTSEFVPQIRVTLVNWVSRVRREGEASVELCRIRYHLLVWANLVHRLVNFHSLIDQRARGLEGSESCNQCSSFLQWIGRFIWSNAPCTSAHKTRNVYRKWSIKRKAGSNPDWMIEMSGGREAESDKWFSFSSFLSVCIASHSEPQLSKPLSFSL